ncbi:MAG: sensor domain-containing diguanylate cyclase [Spirochaetes bacterium]|nr:sensor domain-containing diguanylate cyclase [Spirochaetota bacterium]
MDDNGLMYFDETEPTHEDIQGLEKKIYDLRNLLELGISLSSNLQFESLVESLLYSCIGQMFVEQVVLLLQKDIDVNDFYIHMAKGYDDDFGQDVILHEISPLVGFLENNPYPIEYETLLELPDLADDLKVIEFLNPYIVVPLKSKNSLMGILLLGKKITGGGFSNSEKEFLHYVARFGAVAVENSRLYLMSTLDRMTRLYIHHYFEIRLLEEMKRSQRYNTPLSLLMCDIDHFKRFNDMYGHLQGDSVLKEVAAIFLKDLRKMDIPCRYGGEEFAVILPQTRLEQAGVVAQRLRKIIEQHHFKGENGPLHVTISIGVAQFEPTRDLATKDFISRCDKALYKAKEMGRNRVALFK